jgi:hypothetical protein
VNGIAITISLLRQLMRLTGFLLVGRQLSLGDILNLQIEHLSVSDIIWVLFCFVFIGLHGLCAV